MAIINVCLIIILKLVQSWENILAIYISKNILTKYILAIYVRQNILAKYISQLGTPVASYYFSRRRPNSCWKVSRAARLICVSEDTRISYQLSPLAPTRDTRLSCWVTEIRLEVRTH